MLKALESLGWVLFIVILVVMTLLSFLLGIDHPLPWILLVLLVITPFIHNKIMARKFLVWKDEYSVGIEAMDNDHKKLLNLINQLQTSVQYYTGKEFEISTLEALVDYTKVHFAHEEELMQQNDYPNFAEHKLQHEKMIEKVDIQLQNYKTNPESAITEALAFLKTWLIKHINGTDKEYGVYLNAKGIK